MHAFWKHPVLKEGALSNAPKIEIEFVSLVMVINRSYSLRKICQVFAIQDLCHPIAVLDEDTGLHSCEKMVD